MKKEDYIEAINKKLKIAINPRNVSLQQVKDMYGVLYQEELFKIDDNAVEEVAEAVDETLQKGDYQISFELTLLSKNRGETETVYVSEPVKLNNRKALQTVLDDMSLDYIHNYRNASAVDVLDQKNIDVRDRNAKQLLQLKMKQTPLHYKLLEENVKVNSNPGQCVLDYIMEEIQRSGNWVKYDRQKLKEELGPEGAIMGYSIDDIMRWARNKKDVSVYALDIFNECVDYVSSNYARVKLVFKINEDHCYGVFDKELKSMVAHTKKLDLQKQLFEYSHFASYDVVESIDAYLAYAGTAQVVYVNGVNDLSAVMMQITRETGFLLEYGHYRSACLDMFQHPVKRHLVVAARDYHKRFAIAKSLLDETRYTGFRWLNQSYMQLASAMLKLRIGELPKSSYSPDLQEIMSKYPLKPWVVQVGELGEDEKPDAFDTCKDYTNILLNAKFKWNVFEWTNDLELFKGHDIVPGEYVLKKPVWIGNGTILVDRAQPHNMVKYLLRCGYITLDDIGYVARASKALACDTFKPLVEEMMRRWPKDYKDLVNHLIGSFNQKYRKSTDVAMTTSFDTAIATVMHYSDVEIKMTKVGDVWFLRKEHKESAREGHSPIWRQIIAESLIQLDRMHARIVGPETKVISYNTDAIVVVNPRADFEPVAKENAKPGDICREKPKKLRGTLINEIELSEEFVYNPMPWKERSKDYMLETGAAGMITGMPGARKSTMAKELGEDDLVEQKKMVMVGFTNNVVAVMKKDDVAVKGIANSHTLDSFLPKESSREKWKETVRKLDVIMMDEGSMTAKKWYEFLYSAYLEHPFIFRVFQDPNQCHAIEDDGLWYSYKDCKAVRMMCDQNLCELPYMGGRYDSELHSELVSYMETRKLSTAWKDKKLFTPLECDFNIVMTDKKRIALNAEWHAARKVGKEVVTINNMDVFVGMPLISFVNLKAFNIWNSERYTVTAIKDDYVELARDGEVRTLARSELKSPNFLYGYADTVYRVQGATLRFKYNVQEVSKMRWNHLYVALSRAVGMDSIGIAYTSREFEKQDPPARGQIVEPILVKLQECYIYKIWDSEGEYVGRTNNPERRFVEHLENPTSAKMAAWLKKGGQAYDIIDSFTYVTHAEMNAVEEYYISQLDPKKAMNTQNVAKLKEVEKRKLDVKIDNERFKINETNGSFKIEWRECGDRKKKELKFNVATYATQKAKIEEFQRELIKKFYR